MKDIKEQIAITCFCFEAVTYSHPFGHLGLKYSNLQKQEIVSGSGTALCSFACCTKSKKQLTFSCSTHRMNNHN